MKNITKKVRTYVMAYLKYTEEAAILAEDPEVIRDILLTADKDSWTARYAARNFCCSTQILQEILSRGEDNYMSQGAVENINCPPEALAMVLGRGNNDWVSRSAVKNSNCPPQAIIEWSYKTGKIKKYDPENHEVTPSKNNDLKILESLLDI